MNNRRKENERRIEDFLRYDRKELRNAQQEEGPEDAQKSSVVEDIFQEMLIEMKEMGLRLQAKAM